MPINATSRANSAATGCGNYVAAGPEAGLHSFGQGGWHRKDCPSVAWSWPKELIEVCGREARRFETRPREQNPRREFDVIEDDLNRCLILLVAARYRDRHHRLIVVEEQRWELKGDARTLAGPEWTLGVPTNVFKLLSRLP